VFAAIREMLTKCLVIRDEVFYLESHYNSKLGLNYEDKRQIN
jgi:hypothetical protein